MPTSSPDSPPDVDDESRPAARDASLARSGPRHGASPAPVEGLTRPAPVLTLDAAASLAAAWRGLELQVVLTNGCFDLLHVGHARYLAAARALGDRLVVALNEDASVRRLKGPGRPVLPLAERAELLAALRVVDLVVPFAEATAEEVVRRLQPDRYVKGGDYDHPDREPPEAAVARAVGAEVRYLPFVAGRSTSELLARLRTEPLGESAAPREERDETGEASGGDRPA